MIRFSDFNLLVPNPYGIFHIISLIILVLSIMYLKKHQTSLLKQSNKVYFYAMILIVGMEIYKQFSMSFDLGYFKYPWHIFPYQLCSTPIYILLGVNLIKQKRINQTLINYLAIINLVAGLSVMLVPTNVFTDKIMISIQTMVHHGLMVWIGAYAILQHPKRYTKQEYLDLTILFSILIFIAVVINQVAYDHQIALNLFFISPYDDKVFSAVMFIRENLSYFNFLLVYFLSFISLGLLTNKLFRLYLIKRG